MFLVSAVEQLEVLQGTSWSRAFTFDPDLDISDGYSARAQVRSRPSSEDVLFEWSSDTANVELTELGEVILTLEPEESSAFTWRRGVFDLEVTDPDGVVTRLASGTVFIRREITR